MDCSRPGLWQWRMEHNAKTINQFEQNLYYLDVKDINVMKPITAAFLHKDPE